LIEPLSIPDTISTTTCPQIFRSAAPSHSDFGSYQQHVVNAPGNRFSSSSLLHSVQEVHPLRKMALGLFGSKGDARRNSNSSDDKSSSNEKGTDPELGRIEKPSRRDLDDDSDGSITVGKQMAMEAENAIKYRTCSWQKVCF
jgi:hypothetical protein